MLSGDLRLPNHSGRVVKPLGLSPRYFKEFVKKIPDLDASFTRSFKDLPKILSVISPKLPSYLEYSSKVCSNLESHLSSLTIPRGLEFQQILQIHAGSLLDPIRYI